MSENTGKNTGARTMRSPRSGSVIPTGAHPGNTGGKKGRSGRKPDWLKKFCDNLLADKKSKVQVKSILQDKDHPAFTAMWKAVADRAHGRPAASVTLEAGESLAQLVDAAFSRGR